MDHTPYSQLCFGLCLTFENSQATQCERRLQYQYICLLNCLFKGIQKLFYHAFERLMCPRPWKITNANFTACLSLQNLQSFTHIKKDNKVSEGYFCKLFLWSNRRNYLRFPIRKHSSSTGKGFQGPDGASFFLCLISTICCNDSRLPACAQHQDTVSVYYL